MTAPHPIDADGLHVGIATTIRTYSGILIDPFDANPAQIHINDIAHALARLCRFNGHTVGFLSVARHSLNVERRLRSIGADYRTRLCGLLHDATEAYMADIPRPIKHRPEMSAYRHGEAALEKVIAEALNLPWPMPAEVGEADRYVLAEELEWGRYEVRGFTPVADEVFFLATYKYLVRKVGNGS